MFVKRRQSRYLVLIGRGPYVHVMVAAALLDEGYRRYPMIPNTNKRKLELKTNHLTRIDSSLARELNAHPERSRVESP